MEGDKLPSSIKIPKFVGKSERWAVWRDSMEAIFGALDLYEALDNPRPEDPPTVGAGGGGAVGGGTGGGTGGGRAPMTPTGGRGSRVRGQRGASSSGAGIAVAPDPDAGGVGAVPAPVPPVPVGGSSSAATWDKQARKIYMFLFLNTEGAPQAVVAQFRASRDGVAAWNALKDKYDPQGVLGKAILHRQVMDTTLEPGSDPEDFFIRIERLNARLGELEQPFSDAALVGIILAKLPPSTYAPLVTILDTLDDLEYDTLKTRVRLFWKRRIAGGGATSEDSTKALLGVSKKGGSSSNWKLKIKCYGCQKYGHFQRDCPSGKGSKPSADGAKRGDNQGKNMMKPSKSTYFRPEQKKGVRFTTDDRDGDEHADRSDHALTAVLGNSATTWSDGESDTLITFIVDSGATEHMVSELKYASNVHYGERIITVAGGRTLVSVGTGDVRVKAKDTNGSEWCLVVKDALIIPGLGVNLLSVAKLDERKAYVSFRRSNPFIAAGAKKTRLVFRKGLYEWSVKPNMTEDSGEPVAYVAISSELMHKRMCHRAISDKLKLEESGVTVLRQDQPAGKKCDVCEVAKHRHISFPKELEFDSTLRPFEQVYVDYVGPVEVSSLGDARYATILADKSTGWMNVYTSEYKSSFVTTCLRKYLLDIKALGHKVKSLWGSDPNKPFNIWDSAGRIEGLRSDRGGEFIGEEVLTFCKNAGIRQTFTGPYAPQQQGFSERRNGILFGMVRAMLLECNLEKEFWAEALNAAIHIANRLPVADRLSPYEAVFGKPPRLSHLRVFGCKAFVQTPRATTKKLDPRAWIGIHVGYDDFNWRCYRIFDPATAAVRSAVHVTFDETCFPKPETLMDNDEFVDVEPDHIEEARTLTRSMGSVPTSGPGGAIAAQTDVPERVAVPEAIVGAQPDSLQLLGRNDRLGYAAALTSGVELIDEIPRWLQGYALAASVDVIDDPKSYREAMASDRATDWDGAMSREYDSLIKNGTWDLELRPSNVNVIGSRWVFTIKRNERGEPVRYKARFVAKGFSQKFGYDVFETWAPVTTLTSIRCVLSLTAMFDWECVNMDVDTAFLNAPVSETIYVEQPEGFVEYGPKGEPLVCKLNKSLYGLKQSPRNWNHVIDGWFREYGLKVSEADPCLYVKRSGNATGPVLVILLWVDDLIISGSDVEEIAKFKSAISARFNMKDLGNLSCILGMAVKRNRAARTLEMSQEVYIDTVLKRFGMTDCKPVGTPAEGTLSRSKDAGPSRDYMSLVGSLLYAAMVTRPDIAYAVQALGRHLQSSTDEHFTAAKRVLRYLKGTKDLGLKFGLCASEATIKGYADADWASDKDTRRSVTGYLFMHGGAAISWSSKLQPTVALSSSEAEYMSACAAAQEAIHLRRLMGSLGYMQQGPTIIMEDNMGCIGMSENPIMHRRSKHIDIRFHFLREAVERGEVVLTFIPTVEQVADLLTKALPKTRTQALRGQMLGNHSM